MIEKIKKLFRDKYLIFLILFVILFLFFTNYRLFATQGWDESRHAVQGHLVYDYLKTLLSGDFMSFRTFMQLYQEKGYNAGWFLIDPPFHAFVQGTIFLFLGASPVTASFATELFIVFGAFLLYFLSLKFFENLAFASAKTKSGELVLHNLAFASDIKTENAKAKSGELLLIHSKNAKVHEKKYLALSVVMLYLLSPFLVSIGGLSMLEIPISFTMVGWYYFTFHHEGRKLSLKLSESIKLGIKTNILIGALFLTAATLMKYQSLVYVAAFFIIYTIYYIWKEKKLHLFLLKASLWQGFIVILISAWWLKFSLFDYGFLKRLTELSLTYQAPQWLSPSYTFAYLIQTITETKYLAAFAFLPILVWFSKKKESFLSQNYRLFLFILSVYLVATLLITSQQLRYAIHALPFLFILIVQGIDDLSDFLKRKLNFRYFFVIILLTLLTFSAFASFSLMKEQLQRRGTYNYELVDYLSSLPHPKYLINIDADLEGGTSHYSDGTAYYYNQDLFIFESMVANEKNNIHNPKQMQQYVQLLPVRGVQDYAQLTESPAQTAQKIKTVIVIFKKSNKRFIDLEQLNQALLEKGFQKKELTWYSLYEKG